MKLSFSFLWTAILLVAVLASCTIEKRLYQPGYHVEWNKRGRSVDGTEAAAEKQVADQRIQSEEKHAETAPVLPAATEEMATHSSTVSTAQDRATAPTQYQTVNSVTNHDQQSEALDESNESKSSLKKTVKRDGGPSGVTKGLLMILMGLLLILMGFLFQNILGVFGTILLIIFGLGGTIMIVVGIVIMILG